MSHYAKIEDNVVQEIIVAEQDFIDTLSGEWIQTSYNTRGGIHYNPDGSADDGIALRKNFAGIGFTYNRTLDAFISPQPYASWKLNETTCMWEAPIPVPDINKFYHWDEDTLSWIEI